MTGSILWASLLAVAPQPVDASTDRPVPHVPEQGEASGRVHLQLDADATAGVGGQTFLGTQVRLGASLEHWTTRHALGTWDFGAMFGYQNEPVFLAPWIDPSEVEGATHRILVLGSVGHTVHMGRRRRAALGLHLYGGLDVWRSAYEVTYEDEDVRGDAVVAKSLPVVGGEVRFTYRFHPRVGFNAIAGAPFPTASSYAITWGQFGVGLSFFLR